MVLIFRLSPENQNHLLPSLCGLCVLERVPFRGEWARDTPYGLRPASRIVCSVRGDICSFVFYSRLIDHPSDPILKQHFIKVYEQAYRFVC